MTEQKLRECPFTADDLKQYYGVLWTQAEGVDVKRDMHIRRAIDMYFATVPAVADVIHAWLDEHGRVVSRETNFGGGFVGIERAIPDNWKPLYLQSPSPKTGVDIQSAVNTLRHAVVQNNFSDKAGIEASLKQAIAILSGKEK